MGMGVAERLIKLRKCWGSSIKNIHLYLNFKIAVFFRFNLQFLLLYHRLALGSGQRLRPPVSVRVRVKVSVSFSFTV